MLHKTRAAFALAAAMAIVTPAWAQGLPANGMTATEIASWLSGGSFSAQVKPDPTTAGDQIISTTIDGVDTDIYLYDCSGQGDARRCTSIQYAAGFKPSPDYTLDKVNQWNKANRYIKAYLTAGGTLYGEYDLDVSPGGTYEMLNDSMANWRSVLKGFRSYFSL